MMKAPPSRNKKFFWVVKIIFQFLKIFGLAPFSVQMKTPIEKLGYPTCPWAFVFSKTGMIYNLLITISFPIMAAFDVPDLVSVNYEHKSWINQTTDVVQGLLTSCSAWVIVAVWLFQQKNASRIMNRLLEVDVRLSGLSKLRPNNKKMLVCLAVHLMITPFLWITIWVIEHRKTPLLPNDLVNLCFFYTPSFVIHWFILEYSVAMGMVANELGRVNECLSNLREFSNYLSSSPLLFNSHLEASSLSNYAQLVALRSFHGIRTMLFEISKDVADFFSFPMLLCIAHSFVTMVHQVYYLSIPAIIPNQPFSLSETIFCTIWLFIIVSPIISLFVNVTETVKKAKLTGQIVHTLLVTAMRSEIKSQLEQFSLQLLHEEFNFTAYGFFTLDFTLLHTMMGTTASYLFILIQFR